MSLCAGRRPVAAAVFVSVLSCSLGAHASPNALLLGRVTRDDGRGPNERVVVTLVDRSSGRAFHSAPTDSQGGFRVDSAPAGDYVVLVETPRGAYLASDALPLKAGSNAPVRLALQEAAPTEGGAPPPAGNAPKPGELPKWGKWVVVGGIVVGALLVVDAVTSEETSASPF